MYAIRSYYAGEWWTGDAIEFYTVKAGNQFAFYWVDPSATQGTWSTEDLVVGTGNQPTISHFSTWRTVGGGTPPDNPVPEPGTILLLGLGLAGIAGARNVITSYSIHYTKLYELTPLKSPRCRRKPAAANCNSGSWP